MSMDINPYSLYEVIVAKTVAAADSYEDPIQLAKDQIFTVNSVHDTDQQRDSGAVTSSLSIPTHAEVTIQAGGIPFEAGVMMMGATSSTSNSIVTIDREAGVNRPYFGAIGIAQTEDGRILACGLYKVQLQNDSEINLDGTGNAWMTNEMSALATVPPGSKKFDRFKIYPTLASWESAKPSDGTEFLAWFA